MRRSNLRPRGRPKGIIVYHQLARRAPPRTGAESVLPQKEMRAAGPGTGRIYLLPAALVSIIPLTVKTDKETN